ncbi:MAG TPA: hypothetical protein VEJ86_05545 [Candidatus Binataceae bacterium]|nr:hypothetical protein [Candidatus Binataceae bacterium]
MKLPDLYRDWRVATGLALMVLGASNWVIGATRSAEWSRTIAARSQNGAPTDYRSFDELDAGTGGAVLEPLTAEEHQVSLATARMDFYHATYLAGRAMVVIALLLTLWGAIIEIQSDTRRALRRSRGKEPGRETAPG